MSSGGFIKRHPEAVMFIIGLLILTAGVGSVVYRQLNPPRAVEDDPTLTQGQGGPQNAGRVGPTQNEAVGPYVDRKKKLLTQRASKDAEKSSFAIVVFDSYRKPAEVEQFIKAHRLEVASLQTRVPLPLFKPNDVKLGDKQVAEAVAGETGPAKIAALTKELQELESFLKDVDDPEAEAVFKADAESHRKAIDLMKKDPGIIFALVVEETNRSLAKVAAAPGVRLVDLPDNPAATPKNHTFAGLLPEDKQTAKFGEE